jgi:hypothetical protein
MAHGVDPAVARVQLPALQPTHDRPRAQAKREQLDTRDHPMLAIGQRGHCPVSANFATQEVVNFALAAHGPILAGRMCRRTRGM